MHHVIIGTKLAHYEITNHLGTGGMGEVYQATDTKLGRRVAIKLLPEAFARDADRLARFEREARVLASLNHSHIAAIYGIEESNQRKFLVMELAEGETMQARIKRGPIPVDESLTIAKQIAEALEAAHEKGIVHRDLKPANIKITLQSEVKVLDFGLAKAYEAEASNASLSNSPTLSMAATNAGVILGTAAYMSPEQAKGRAVDRRSDIFAFGCVLYEMLTGKPVFDGEDVAEILSRVLQREPDWTQLPADIPSRVRELLRLCLEKNVKNRRSDATDIRLDIEQAVRESGDTLIRAVIPANSRFAWIVATTAMLSLIVLVVMYMRLASVEAPETRFEIGNPPTDRVSFSKLSPDGRKVVFAAAAEGRPSQLWLRSFESDTAQPLAGTENASWPFWSPDSRSIGFVASGKLMRRDLAGGGSRSLADTPNPAGAAWGPDGTVLINTTSTSPLYRVSANGGPMVEATHLSGPDEASHRFPDFLPDGRHFLFFVAGTPNVQGIYVGSLDTKETYRLMESDSAGVFAAPGYVLFRREENLLAQRLDLNTFRTTGDSFSVADRVSSDEGAVGEIAVSTSHSGLIAYRAPINKAHQLTWFDRAGRQTGTLGDVETMAVSAFPFRISPDGRTVALGRRSTNGNPDVWLIETARGAMRHLTSDQAFERAPVWAPEGNRITFASRRNGPENIWVKPIDGGAEERLRESTENDVPADWSPDSRFILFSSNGDLWALPLDGDRKPVAVGRTDSVERAGRFSPDGRRVAYQSNETGQNEINVISLSGPGVRTQVSTSGGVDPRWPRDGREIFYVDLESRLMAVPLMPQSNGQLEFGTPTALFTIPQGAAYDVTRDGQRILIDKPVGQASTPPITIILNWHPERVGK